MTIRIVIGIFAVVCGSLCGMIGTFKSYEMMDKVNERLSKEQQFDPSWWYLSKNLRLRSQYKRLYPDGRLLVQVHVLTALMFACFLVTVWSFAFFAR